MNVDETMNAKITDMIENIVVGLTCKFLNIPNDQTDYDSGHVYLHNDMYYVMIDNKVRKELRVLSSGLYKTLSVRVFELIPGTKRPNILGVLLHMNARPYEHGETEITATIPKYDHSVVQFLQDLASAIQQNSKEDNNDET